MSRRYFSSSALLRSTISSSVEAAVNVFATLVAPPLKSLINGEAVDANALVTVKFAKKTVKVLDDFYYFQRFNC